MVVAEVEVVEDRDRNHGRVAADSATHTAPAHSAWDSAAATATEKEAFRSRLGQLHRLVNNRKGSLNATNDKNAEANDRAYDMKLKTIQALDTLTQEYGNFEVSMKKVMFEHEEGDVLYAIVTEATDELERAPNDQDRLQDELDCSCEDLATAAREFSDCWAAQEAANAKLSSAFREVCDGRAAHEAICVEARRAWQKTYDLERKASEAQENLLSHRERTRRISNEHARRKPWSTIALELWSMPFEMRARLHSL